MCSLVESSLWFLCDLCDALATFAVKSFEPQSPGRNAAKIAKKKAKPEFDAGSS